MCVYVVEFVTVAWKITTKKIEQKLNFCDAT